MLNPPTESELKQRLETQLAGAADKYAVTLVWKGLLAGLFEWGFIPLDVYTRLENLLPRGGEIEVAEYFNGEPLSVEMEQEVRMKAAVKPG
jgi:hypothetical protein